MSFVLPAVVVVIVGVAVTGLLALRTASEERWRVAGERIMQAGAESSSERSVPSWLTTWPILTVAVLIMCIPQVDGAGPGYHGMHETLWPIMPVALALLAAIPEPRRQDDSP